LARFTGREWLIKRVDKFIADRPRGYVIIQAEAGVGKIHLGRAPGLETTVAMSLHPATGRPCA
jgi:hypothetical protein